MREEGYQRQGIQILCPNMCTQSSVSSSVNNWAYIFFLHIKLFKAISNILDILQLANLRLKIRQVFEEILFWVRKINEIFPQMYCTRKN